MRWSLELILSAFVMDALAVSLKWIDYKMKKISIGLWGQDYYLLLGLKSILVSMFYECGFNVDFVEEREMFFGSIVYW